MASVKIAGGADTAEATRPATAKPAYRDRYPCAACNTGYLDCAGCRVVNLQCCKDCDGHLERFTLGNDAYTQDEYDDMNRRYQR